MTWFRVDDKMHDGPKVRRALRSHPTKRRDVAAMGLWVMAGSWCGEHQEMGGFVPAEILERFDDDHEDLAARLVDCGLWEEAERDGEDGYQFHDYDDLYPYQQAAQQGTVGNHVRWHVERQLPDPDCPLCVPKAAPAAKKKPPSKQQQAADETFEQFWATYPRRIGKGRARTAWRGACRKEKPDVLIAAAEAFAEQCRTKGTEAQYIPHPTTWLNAERWADEAPAPGTLGRHLQPADRILEPPSGLSDMEYLQWLQDNGQG